MNSWREAPAPVIDLGLARQVPEPRPDRPGNRPRLWAPATRLRWALAGCLTLVLLAVAGAAPPPQPSLFLARSQPPASPIGYSVAGDQLYVLTGDPRPALSAYHLPDGRPLWSTPASPADFMVAWRTGGVLLVLTQPARSPCCQLAAYDGADGDVRWSRRASVIGVDTDDSLAALDHDGSTTVVDVRSGRPRWGARDAATRQAVWAHSILLIYRDGTAERRDMGTGEVQATGRVHPSDIDLFASTIVDGQLVIGYSSGYRSGAVAAYDLETLTLTWWRSAYPVDAVEQCGPVVCVRAGHGLEAVDPHTGAVRWREPGWYGLEQGGQLLAVMPDLGTLRAIGVIDPLTGRVLLDLGSWQVHPGDSPAAELVLTRTSSATGRTTVAVADLTRLTIEVIGAVSGRLTECRAGEASLACRSEGGKLQLWAYRR